MSDTIFDQTKNLDITIGDGQRSTRIIKEDGLVKMGQSFVVDGAMETIAKMKQEAEKNPVRSKETRVAAILTEAQLQIIANKYHISTSDLISKPEWQDVLWAEGTSRDNAKTQIYKA